MASRPLLRSIHLPRTVTLSARQFSSTPSTSAKHSKKALEELLRGVPPYPYPIKNTYKQAWFGLYGGKHIQFGNNIPEEERTITRRTWHPNIKSKKLWSFALGRWIETRVSTSVLRTIDKVGGLDNYLLGDKPARIKELGPMGWKLRYEVQTSKAMQIQYAKQRVDLGVCDSKTALEGLKRAGLTRSSHGRKRLRFRGTFTPLFSKDSRRKVASAMKGVQYGPEVWKWRRGAPRIRQGPPTAEWSRAVQSYKDKTRKVRENRIAERMALKVSQTERYERRRVLRRAKVYRRKVRMRKAFSAEKKAQRKAKVAVSTDGETTILKGGSANAEQNVPLVPEPISAATEAPQSEMR